MSLRFIIVSIFLKAKTMLQEALVDKSIVTNFNNVIFDLFISYSKVLNVILKLEQDCCLKC